MNRSSLPVGLSTLKKWKDEKDTLHFDIAYQRHQGMWGLPQKSMLVWSILADSYIPPIVLTKSEEDKVDEKGKSMSVYSVLDGLQRLSNLFDLPKSDIISALKDKGKLLGYGLLARNYNPDRIHEYLDWGKMLDFDEFISEPLNEKTLLKSCTQPAIETSLNLDDLLI